MTDTKPKSTEEELEKALGSRGRALRKIGILSEILWSERYPDQEGPGEFVRTRKWLETASLEGVFDLWCRGQNLIGFAEYILRRVDQIRKVCKERR